jgi:HAD superfamily hydrolase (TIGR01509 family)
VTLKAVFFDVGETLVDETRQWAAVAAQQGVPVFTLFAVLGGMIERRRHHRDVHDLFAPNRPLADWPDIEARDFYPDALACLRQCKNAGWLVGLAGNQPASAEAALRGLNLGVGVDVVASSETWGVEKPSPEFFAKLAEAAGCPPGEIAYVGDRVDNDVVPARAAGMHAVFVVRGPWGWLQQDWPEAAEASLTVRSLDGLAGELARLFG